MVLINPIFGTETHESRSATRCGIRKRGISVFFGLERGETLLLVALAYAAKEMRIRTIEIAQCLLQRLTVHLTQPGGRRLLFESREFGRKVVVRKRYAGLLEVFALSVERPIPYEPPRARELIEQAFLLGSRVEAIAIRCSDHSLHDSIIPDQALYYNRFSALERQI